MQLLIKPCDVPYEYKGRDRFVLPFYLTSYLDVPLGLILLNSSMPVTHLTYNLHRVNYNEIEREVYVLEGFEKQVFTLLDVKNNT